MILAVGFLLQSLCFVLLKVRGFSAALLLHLVPYSVAFAPPSCSRVIAAFSRP
jgi:Zn-dependent membrane protease YugP